MVALPLLLLGGIEAALRVAGYGYSPDLFKRLEMNHQAFLVNNEDFSLRFFPPQLVRLLEPVRLAARKPPNTYRIFILGESAAMGDPEPAYAASRYLEALLSARFPQTRFEVVNLGITAINSHVILPIARECARHDGDLWIIYMGNNEMVGPFGAATVFGAKVPPLGLIRLNLAIQKMRLGQLLINVARKFNGGKANATSWGGMEMFVGNQLPADDPRREMVYRNFERNLNDIVMAGLNSGTKILLNTVAVNLKDCAPFASATNSHLPVAELAQFDWYFAGGVGAADQEDFAAATRQFEQAARIDPGVSELQFRLGQSLLALTNLAGAREYLQLACDDDALPFRADSRINTIIRNEQAKIGGDRLVLFDAAAVLAAEAPGGICGQETFYEHVHFNFDGNYRLGRAWAEQVVAMMPVTMSSQETAGWITQEACERRLGLSDWNRSLVIQNVVNRLQQAPLSSQLGNAKRLETLQAQLPPIHQRMQAADEAKIREDFLEVLRQFPDDYYLHENFALFLESINDLPGATAQCQRVHDLIPQDCVLYFQQGRLFEKQRHYAEAESSFREAVSIRPSLTDGWVQLGDVLALEGNYEAALASYDAAMKQRPLDSRTIFFRGNVLARLNRHAEAIEDYRTAAGLNPADWEAHFELAGELDSESQLPEACDEFAAAVRLNPNNARAHFNHGVLLAKLGRAVEARREFEETLRLEPAYRKAHDYLVALPAVKK